MEATWAVPLVSAVATILGLYLAKPDRPKIAWITAGVVVLLAFWQSYSEYGRVQARHILKQRVIGELAIQNRHFLSTPSSMIVAASDGWLPTNPQEFFSGRTAELLCTQLNIDKNAPVTSSVSYDEWLAEDSRRFADAIRKSATDGGSELDADLLRALVKVEGSQLLRVGEDRVTMRQFDQSHAVERPPLLCWGLEPLVADSLHELETLWGVLTIEEGRYRIEQRNDWLEFPSHYTSRNLGGARFTPDQLVTWRRAHPNAPGPTRFGKGDPNKNPVFDPRSAR